MYWRTLCTPLALKRAIIDFLPRQIDSYCQCISARMSTPESWHTSPVNPGNNGIITNTRNVTFSLCKNSVITVWMQSIGELRCDAYLLHSSHDTLVNRVGNSILYFAGIRTNTDKKLILNVYVMIGIGYCLNICLVYTMLHHCPVER